MVRDYVCRFIFNRLFNDVDVEAIYSVGDVMNSKSGAVGVMKTTRGSRSTRRNHALVSMI
jgi:hypothetical protein